MKTSLLTSALMITALMSVQAIAQPSLSKEDVQISARCELGMRTYDAAAGKATYTDLTPASVSEVVLEMPKPIIPGPSIDLNPAASTDFKFQVNTPDGLMKVSASIFPDRLANDKDRVHFLNAVNVQIANDNLLIQNTMEMTAIRYTDLLNPETRTNGVWFTKNINSSDFRQYFGNCVYHLKKK